MVLVLYAVDLVFTFFTLAIIARALMSWFPQDPFRPNPIVALLNRITDPILDPIHRIIPPIGMLDITPIAALVILQILQAIIDNILSGMIP